MFLTLMNLPSNIYNRAVFAYRKPAFVSFPIIKGKIHLVSEKGAISFGQNVRINSSLGSDPIGGSTRTILFAEPGAKINIGNNVGISNTAIHAARSVTIEDNAMIGGDCRIYDTDFHSIAFENRMKKPDTTVKSSPVVIREGTFIGASAMILKGVHIGKRSVVAAGSVVTKDIPPDEIWGGEGTRSLYKLNQGRVKNNFMPEFPMNFIGGMAV